MAPIYMYFHKLYLIWKLKNKQKKMNELGIQRDNVSEICMVIPLFYLEIFEKIKN